MVEGVFYQHLAAVGLEVESFPREPVENAPVMQKQFPAVVLAQIPPRPLTKEVAPALAPVLQLHHFGLFCGCRKFIALKCKILPVWRFYSHLVPQAVSGDILKLLPHAPENSVLIGRIACVPVHQYVISQRSYDSYLPVPVLYWQNAVIFQQYHLFTRRLSVKPAVFLAVDDFITDVIKLTAVHLPQFQPRIYRPCKACIYLVPFYKTVIQCLFSRRVYQISRICHYITTRPQSERICFCKAVSVSVRRHVLREIPAVTHHEPQPPLVFQHA
ncbi:hypothetical protein CUS_4891 [Ruminococcus albus 8]|uniref:Uncharacterized protein n=1 Tax=Ruminococcus albus 8 TaxID=246199 RepID=E9SF52_RUMAL|nr:hypothetical protein CUS_4891 [Ruminococcus albus 8]